MPWIRKHRDKLIVAISLAVLVLILLNLIKYDVVTPTILANNKDAINALANIVTMAVLVIGGVFSYYRFFRGRTFSPRAELALDIKVLPATQEVNLHVVELSVKNVGAATIWDPIPLIRVTSYGPRHVPEYDIDTWWEGTDHADSTNRAGLIDSGETAFFVTQQEVAADVWAVTYAAIVRSRSKALWARMATVENRVQNAQTDVEPRQMQ